MTASGLAAASEEVLAAAATCFAGVPGVDVVDEGDLVRSIAPGRPYPFCNSVVRLRVADDRFAERVGEVDGAYRDAGLPVSWWVSDMSLPVDAADRLTAMGMGAGGSEAVMAIELGAWPDPRLLAVPGVDVTVVEAIADLDEWIGVIGASYGWADPAKVAAMRGLYDPRTPHGRDGRRVQVLARIGGHAVGAASLFETAGTGWVTNVGTIPDARGRGVGAAVTLATLRLAVERRYPSAYLAASPMGEPVYRRLGFVTVGRLTHLVGPAPVR